MGLLALNLIPEWGARIDLMGFLGDSPDAGGGCGAAAAGVGASFLIEASFFIDASEPTEEVVLSRTREDVVDLSLFERSLRWVSEDVVLVLVLL